LSDEPRNTASNDSDDKTQLEQREGGTQDPSLDVVAARPAEAREVIGERRGMFGASDNGDTSGYGGLRQPVELPGTSTPPYGGWMDDVAAALARATRDNGIEAAVEKVIVHRGEITFFIRREHLAAVARLLRDDADLRFELCSGVSGVHYPGDTGRELHAVYHLLSMTHNRRIRLEVTAPDSDPHVPSVVPTYPTADWHERETYDMFGIIFDGHPALTRIEMPDDWPGHPQRKDYPLGGIPVEYKGATVPPVDNRRAYS
jgi:NADH-quinone oxidoreductase subunit C